MKNDKIENVLSISLGLLSIIAIFGLLINNKFEKNELFGSIINFTQVAIPVLVLIATRTIKSEAKSLKQIGKEALIDVQKKNPDILLSPRYHREGYDPEKGKGQEYLFVKKNELNSKLRAKFIPIEPLEQGVLVVYIQKGTLVYGLNYTSVEANRRGN